MRIALLCTPASLMPPGSTQSQSGEITLSMPRQCSRTLSGAAALRSGTKLYCMIIVNTVWCPILMARALSCCPPNVEAAIYMGSSDGNIYAELDRVTMPVVILRARREEGDRTKMDFSLSPTFPGLASLMPNARDVYLPELTHFIPMQAPALTAEYLRGER